MHIAGSHYRLVELFSQGHDLPVDILNILNGIYIPHTFRSDHEFVVATGLDLQIVIEFHQSGNLGIRLSVQQCPVQFSRLAGTSQYQSFSVLHHQTLGNPGMFVKIGQMRLGHQTIQVDTPQIIFRQNNGMVRGHLLHGIHTGSSQCIDFRQIMNVLLFQHFNKFHENMGRALRIIHGSVMILQGNSQGLGHRIQRMLRLVLQKYSGNAHGIHIGKLLRIAQSSAILHNETHIKAGIVSHHDTAFTELQKLRQDHVDLRGIHDILIPDTGKLFDLEGNGHIRIDKGGKTIHDLSTGYLYRTDLDNAVVDRGKSRGLDIEYHIILMQTLSLIIRHYLFQIIHQIGFHTVNDLEEILLVRILVSGFFPLAFFRFPQVIPDMVCIGKTLYHAVIRDGNGPMSPFVGALYNVLGLGDTVHITHLCMTVQLHTLSGGGIHSRIGKIRDLLDSRNGTDSQLVIELIHHTDSLDL